MKTLLLICLFLSGCSSLGQPIYDPRIVVGQFDSVQVRSHRELNDYRCREGLIAIPKLYGSIWYFECRRPSIF